MNKSRCPKCRGRMLADKSLKGAGLKGAGLKCFSCGYRIWQCFRIRTPTEQEKERQPEQATRIMTAAETTVRQWQKEWTRKNGRRRLLIRQMIGS